MCDIIRRDPVTGDLIYPDRVIENVERPDIGVDSFDRLGDVIKRLSVLEDLVKFIQNTISEHEHVIDDVISEIDDMAKAVYEDDSH